MIVTRDEMDVAPADDPTTQRAKNETSGELLQSLDKSAADAKAALAETTEEHLLTSWKLLARGQVVWEGPRHEMIRDTLNHWAHHRGQMTVYRVCCRSCFEIRIEPAGQMFKRPHRDASRR